MPNVYVTQSGSGLADGSTLPNSIAVGDLTSAHWNTPIHSTDGVERMYFSGDITTAIFMGGDGGTSNDLRLWVDLTDAILEVAGAINALSTNGRFNLTITGGEYISTVDNSSSLINVITPENNVTIKNVTITNNHGNSCIHVWCTDTDCDNTIVEDCLLSNPNPSSGNAVFFDRSSTPGDRGAYKNPTVRRNTITGGKIIAGYTNPAQQIDIDNRRDEGWDIDDNTVSYTPEAAIQLRFTRTSPTSYVRNNRFSNIGIGSPITNAIQTGNNFGLIIEHNTIDKVINSGAVGDGSAIMIDWVGETSGAYSENCIVRYNTISGCQSWENAAAIAIWAAINTQVYGNVCTGNNVGISISDGIAADTFTIVSVSSANPCVIEYSHVDDREIFSGERVVISGNTGSAPDDINGTYGSFDILYVDATHFSLKFVDTSDSAGSGTIIEGINRGFGNVVYKNTCDNNTRAGFLTKFGAQDVTLHSNILSGSKYGCLHIPQYRSELATETYNDYHNNSVNNILDGATPTAVDTTSLEVNPLFIPDSYQLSASSTLIGAGLAGVDIGAIDYVAREYGGGGGGSITYNLLTAQLLRVSSGGSSTPYVPPVVPPVDTTAPTVTAFVIPATSDSYTIPVSTFTATDAVGVTGYLITESATPPLAGDAGWSGTAQTSYVVSADATYTLYGWAKDAAGNVSSSLNDTCEVILSAPVGTAIAQSDMPYTIATAGDYYAAEDLTSAGNGIINAASGAVTFDGNFKTLTFNTGDSSNVYGISGSGSRDDFIIKNIYIDHAGTGVTRCYAIYPRGANWEISYYALRDSGANGTYHGISNDELIYYTPNIKIHHGYIEADGYADAGTATATSAIVLQDRNSTAYAEVHDNISTETHWGIRFRNWAQTATPGGNSGIVYNNMVSTNRIENSKGPYALNLGEISRNLNLYDNAVCTLNGRGIYISGGGQGSSDGSRYHTIEYNQVGCNFYASSKLGLGTFPDTDTYGLRDRYHSGDNTIDNNTFIVNNEVSGGTARCQYIGSDDADTDMVNLVNSNNTMIALQGTGGGATSAYKWDQITSIENSDNLYLSDDVFEVFEFPGTDLRTTVTGTDARAEASAYTYTETTPAQVTGLTVQKFFNSYVLKWDENTEDCVLIYQVYKDGVAITQPTYSGRKARAANPGPFHVEYNDTTTTTFTVSAISLGGTEGAQSAGVLSANAVNGWQ